CVLHRHLRPGWRQLPAEPHPHHCADATRLGTVHCMPKQRGSRWYQRLAAHAELAGDHQQQDIAHTMGVSKSAVTAWANEGTPPSPESILAAAEAYGFDPLEQFRLAYLPDDENGEGKKGDPKGLATRSRAAKPRPQNARTRYGRRP